MRKDHLLKRLDLILQLHEVGDCLVAENMSRGAMTMRNADCLPLIRIINSLQGDILLVLK